MKKEAEEVPDPDSGFDSPQWGERGLVREGASTSLVWLSTLNRRAMSPFENRIACSIILLIITIFERSSCKARQGSVCV